jgi:hypothetical protein
MKTTTLFIIFILSILSPHTAFSQIYKCTTKGKLIYQSDPCPIVKSKYKKNHPSSFEFDGWYSGMTIHEMKQVAKVKQLNMSPGTSTFTAKYNEKLLNSKPSQRHYTYRTKLMGKTTTVNLFFTKLTGELYQVKATFQVVMLKPEERKYFYESLYSQLSDKYGKAKHIQRNSPDQSLSGAIMQNLFSNILVGSLQAWGLNTNNIVSLSFKKNYHLMSSYKLIYKNVPLTNIHKKEITYELKQRTNNVLTKDKNRL